MRAWAVFRRMLRLQWRDRLNLVLTLTMGGGFVLLYYLITGGGSTTFVLLLLEEDRPAAAAGPGEAVREAVESIRYPNGQVLVRVERVSDRAEAEERLRSRSAAALLVLPPRLDEARGAGSAPPEVTMVGDLTHPGYVVAAMAAQAATAAYLESAAGRRPLLTFREQALGGSGGRTEFEQYVPGLVLISAMMMLFTAALAVAREVEAGTLRPLQLTRMTAFDYLVGVTAVQVLVAVGALLTTLGVAAALGFRSEGTWGAAVAVGSLAAVAVVGIGLLVACFARTSIRAYLAASVPFILLMFFSGAVYPMPKPALFTVAGRVVGGFDFLPTTHAVAALNRIMTLGAGFGEVAYELGMLAGLSLLYFAAGVLLFRRMHLRPIR